MSHKDHAYCVVRLLVVRNQYFVYKDFVEPISELLIDCEVLILVVVLYVRVYILRSRNCLIQEVFK